MYHLQVLFRVIVCFTNMIQEIQFFKYEYLKWQSPFRNGLSNFLTNKIDQNVSPHNPVCEIYFIDLSVWLLPRPHTHTPMHNQIFCRFPYVLKRYTSSICEKEETLNVHGAKLHRQVQ